MSLVAYSLSSAPRSDGVVGSYKPITVSSPTVAWDNTNLATLLQNQPNGTAIAQDMRARLTGAGAATASLALETVSGDDAATNGWSISGDDLISAAGTDGVGVLRVKATHNSIDYYSSNIPWSIVTPASPDILSPTAPLIKSITAPGPTQVDITLFPPVDPKSPGSDADGLLNIRVERGPAGGALSQIDTISVDAGDSLQFALTNIGSVSPAPSATQGATGADWEIDCAGNEIWNQSDDFAFVHASIAGNFIASGLFKEITGIAGAFSMAGIMARSSIAANSAFAHCLSMCSPAAGANEYVKGEFRLASGSTAQQVAAKTSGLSGDRYLALIRLGDLFSFYYWQTILNDWVLLGTQSIAMGASCQIGLAVNSNLIGSEVTANVENFAVSTLAEVTYSDTTVVANTAYDYRFRAEDRS